MLAFFAVNKLKDSGENNSSEKVGNCREDWGKGLVQTIVCGRNGTGTPPVPSQLEGWSDYPCNEPRMQNCSAVRPKKSRSNSPNIIF